MEREHLPSHDLAVMSVKDATTCNSAHFRHYAKCASCTPCAKAPAFLAMERPAMFLKGETRQMKTIKFIDMTLRQAGQSYGKVLTFKEKLEIARSLDRLKADTIELAPISGSKADQLANRTIAQMVQTRISAAVDIADGNVAETWESVRVAKKPKLNIIVPVSPVQMEYICHKKAPAMLAMIEEQVKTARYLCEFVEFTAEDATRAERDFLFKAIETAIAAGANKVTVCDTAGIMLPDQFGVFVADILANVPAMENIELYVQISDSLGMALACAAAAIRQGASGVKCMAVADGYPTMEALAHFVQVKGAELDIATGVRVTELHRVVGQIEKILEPQEEESGRFAGLGLGLEEVTNVCLEASDDMAEVNRVVAQLGYDLTEGDKAKVYEEFKRVAAKKQFVGTKELDAIVANSAMQVPSTYKVKTYVINSGNIINAMANILLEKDGVEMRDVGVGDGPIDAAFAAIEKIVGHHYELDDFQIQTVTEGRDAMGSAFVKLRSAGRVYSGTGISTDIIGASIRAYLSALNKILYEEDL